MRVILAATVAMIVAGALGTAVLNSRPADAHPSHRVLPALAKHRPAIRPINSAKQAAVLADLRAKLDARRNNRPGTSAPPTSIARLDPQLYRLAGVPGAVGSDGIRPTANGTVEVSVTGPSAAAAARAVGGRVIASFNGTVSVALPPSKLRSLAGQPGVGRVQPAVRAMPTVISEGVQSSGAQAWVNNGNLGNGGAGVKVGIVDAGFGNLAAEESAGHLDSTKIHYTAGGSQDHCADQSGTDHGTAVAEIVYQMAPQADLYLYCVDDNVGFSQSSAQLVAAGVKIVNSSLGFTAETRGDGFGGASSTELAVRTAREAGVLWIQSAGNTAEDHWTGNLVDANRDGYVDLLNTTDAGEADVTALDPQTSGTVVLSWDQWPSTSLPITLAVAEFDGSTDQQIGDTAFVTHGSGGDPTLGIDISNDSTTSGDYHIYEVFVVVDTGTPTLRYDLSYGGDVYPSYLSDQNPSRAAGGSMLEPATSPWALAVGAASWHDNSLEPFSSRGPTIDGRIKPDLLGYDGVSSNISDVQSSDGTNTGFYGTSAAAPHVAGAAALVASQNPAMDASDIEAFLEKHVSPPTNTTGHGLLDIRPASASSVHGVVGSGYVPLVPPLRIVDTRSGLGGRTGPMVAGTELSVTLPSAVPNNASSVVLNVTGINAKGTTYLSVYPDTFSGSTNLSLSSIDNNAAVAAVVRVNSSHGFKLLNRSANTDAVVDVVGYFTVAGSSGDGYAPINPTRILDTRSTIGGHQRWMYPNETITIPVAPASGTGVVPAGASAVVINLTALTESHDGYLMTYPSTPSGTSSLDYKKAVSRSNLAVVALASNGTFKLQNRTAYTDVIVDVVGYFSSSAPGRFVTLPAPVSIVDTRTGKGGRIGAMTSNAVLTEDGAGLNQVPYHATALWTGYDAVLASASGYLTVYAAGGAAPHTSNMDYGKGRTVANAVVANLSQPSNGAGRFSTVNRVGTTTITEDLFGYFAAS
ncbi:MAG TPA: S8 family serine peptidase [Jatrophihabitans sp.]|nr:S8 family serine peptidase [Jatrophihabitans sp.]